MEYPKITLGDVEAAITKESYTVLPDGRTTICQLTLKNGFTVDGKSACVCIENFNAELGNQYSREKALDQVWFLLGYDLSTKMSLMSDANIPEGDGIFTLGTPTTYVGTKVVHAVPMDRGSYNRFRGWELAEGELATDPGYLVMYADGGKPNVDGFSGYVSWSPQDVFEQSYSDQGDISTKRAATFLDRLRKEIHELQDRSQKLVTFHSSQIFKDLDKADRDLLMEQEAAMMAYLSVLTRRLERLAHKG